MSGLPIRQMRIAWDLKIIIAAILFPVLCSCDQSGAERSGQPVERGGQATEMSGQLTKSLDISKALRVETVSIGDYGPKMVSVKVRITNVSGKHIKNAQVTCLVKNSAGQDISFEKHYVIKSTEGGLATGEATYFEYAIDVNVSEAKRFLFQINSVNWE